jgi:hypothetical protein
VDRAVDDQGQLLAPAKEVGPGQGGRGQVLAFQGQGQVDLVRANTVTVGAFGGPTLRLRAGSKPTHNLKELSGKVTAMILKQSAPLLTVTDLLDSVGKVGKTSDGGTFELVEASKSDDGKVEVSFILDSPAAAAAGVAGVQGVPAIAVQAVPAVPVEAGVARAVAPAMAGGVVVRRGFNMNFAGGSNQEFHLLDDRGNNLPQTSMSIQPAPNRENARQYKLTFDASKARGVPSKFVISARSPVKVEIPFTLKDVKVPTRSQEAGDDQ